MWGTLYCVTRTYIQISVAKWKSFHPKNNPMEKRFFEKWQSLTWSRNYQHFMELRCSLPHSQGPATCPCSEPHESSPKIDTLISLRFILISSFHVRLGALIVPSVQVFRLKFCMNLSSLRCSTHHILFGLITLTISVEEYTLWISSITQFSSVSCFYFSESFLYRPNNVISLNRIHWTLSYFSVGWTVVCSCILNACV